MESVLGHFADLSLDGRISELFDDILRYCSLVEVTPHDEVDKAFRNVFKGEEEKMSQAVRVARKALADMARESFVAEGEAKGRAGSIIRILTRRFRTIPKPTKEKITSIVNIDRLDQLTDQALDCQSLDEFAKALNNK